MTLSDADKLFFTLRRLNRIVIAEEHVLLEHTDRGYSFDELIKLVKSVGKLQDTTDKAHKGQRFYWRTKDTMNRKVRLVLEFIIDRDGHYILIISAGERT